MHYPKGSRATNQPCSCKLTRPQILRAPLAAGESRLPALQRGVGNQAAIRWMNAADVARRSGSTDAAPGRPKATTYEWTDPDAIDYSRQIGDVVGTFEAPNAGSACNIDTGEYEIKFNDNHTCTRDCTQFHEERHQADLGPCCRAAAAAVAAGADRRTVQIQWNSWVTSGAGPWSECNAFGVSVACGQSVQSFNQCNAVSSRCCADADFYLRRMRTGQLVACNTAPPDLPDCPF